MGGLPSQYNYALAANQMIAMNNSLGNAFGGGLLGGIGKAIQTHITPDIYGQIRAINMRASSKNSFRDELQFETDEWLKL